MAKKQVIQVGGTKEAPLAIVGGDAVSEQEEDASYDRPRQIRELWGGFLVKFIKWQAVIDEEGYEVEKGKRGLEVFVTPNGLHIAKPGETHKPEDKLMEMRSERQDEGESGHRLMLTAKPGPAGEKVFIDLDGMPIKEAKVIIDYGWHGKYQAVNINATVPSSYGTGSLEIVRGKFLESIRGEVSVTSGHNREYYMSEKYATQLLNTIDCFIPGAQPPTLQTGSRATSELQTPKALPAPRRRTARRT